MASKKFTVSGPGVDRPAETGDVGPLSRSRSQRPA